MIGSALAGSFADGTPWSMGSVIALCGADTFLSTLIVPGRSSAVFATAAGSQLS